MSVYIESIGNQKISYPNHEDVEFYSLSEYITLAKKSISSFANGFYHGLAAKMLKDEDAISNIAYAMMLADWRYDANYTGKNKSSKTRYSYRNQCALWAIKTHISKNKKKKNKHLYSLDYVSTQNNNENDAYSYIVDERIQNPIDDLIESEERDVSSRMFSDLLDTDELSQKQKDFIRLYYMEDYTYAEIGKKYSMTREGIRQSIINAIQILREKRSETNV